MSVDEKINDIITIMLWWLVMQAQIFSHDNFYLETVAAGPLLYPGYVQVQQPGGGVWGGAGGGAGGVSLCIDIV